jgi:hypothetical protein
MGNQSVVSGGQTFADFMYAVVVGVAFSGVSVNDSAAVLFVTLFLLVVVIEDYFMYQTQVKPHTDLWNFVSFQSLLFELAILLAWFLAFLSRKDAGAAAPVCLIVFFIAKWIASLKHLVKASQAGKQWLVHRDHLFLISAVTAAAIAIWSSHRTVAVAGVPLGFDWVVLAIAWAIQTMAWWWIVRQRA